LWALVDYIRANEGTVHVASLVILRARQLFDRYLAVYSDKRKEAVYVTYYKQGPSYLRRYQDALAAFTPKTPPERFAIAVPLVAVSTNFASRAGQA
jgi:hypothetical protein